MNQKSSSNDEKKQLHIDIYPVAFFITANLID